MRFEHTVVKFGSGIEKNAAGRPSRALGGAGGPCLLTLGMIPNMTQAGRTKIFQKTTPLTLKFTKTAPTH